MLTHDSKATPLTRLLFAMTPMYARTPRQLGGLRVVTVDTPEAVARAWALRRPDPGGGDARSRARPGLGPGVPLAPPACPVLGRGGDPGAEARRRAEAIFDRARDDPAALIRDARAVAADPTGTGPDEAADQLRAFLDRRYRTPDEADTRFDWRTTLLLRNRPEALVEAARILVARPDAVRRVLLRAGFTDPGTVGGYLDRDVAGVGPR